MKKTGFITLIIIALATLLLSGCGNSVYFESWFSTNGYVVKDGEDFDSFVKGTTGKPDGTPKAVMWDHRYDRTPRCQLTASQWNKDEIEYEELDNGYYNFTITSTPREINGLIFYCDSENVYVINNKYDKYNDDERNGYSNNNHYRFRVNINGIRDLDLFMYKRNGDGSW